MKTNGNDPSSPVSVEVMNNYENNGRYNDPYSKKPFGLTKREYFTGMAMQGMLHCGAMTEHGIISQAPETIAMLAVNQADALIEALNKEE